MYLLKGRHERRVVRRRADKGGRHDDERDGNGHICDDHNGHKNNADDHVHGEVPPQPVLAEDVAAGDDGLDVCLHGQRHDRYYPHGQDSEQDGRVSGVLHAGLGDGQQVDVEQHGRGHKDGIGVPYEQAGAQVGPANLRQDVLEENNGAHDEGHAAESIVKVLAKRAGHGLVRKQQKVVVCKQIISKN